MTVSLAYSKLGSAASFRDESRFDDVGIDPWDCHPRWDSSLKLNMEEGKMKRTKGCDKTINEQSGFIL